MVAEIRYGHLNITVAGMYLDIERDIDNDPTKIFQKVPDFAIVRGAII